MAIFTETEAATYLGGETSPIPKATLRYWRCVGGGPDFIKMGRSVRYSQAALDDYLERNSKNSTSEQ